MLACLGALDGRMVKGKSYGEGTSTPGAATADLAVVTEEVEGGLVAEGNVDDAVVGEGAHGSKSGALLSTVQEIQVSKSSHILQEPLPIDLPSLCTGRHK